MIVHGERGMKREIPEHLGEDSTLWHRTGSAQVSELVVHPRVEWFEVGGDAGRGPGAKRGSERRKEGGAESIAWRFRLERIPPRPRGGAAAAGSGVGGAVADGSARARENSAGVPASSRCAAVVFGMSEEIEELRWE